MKCLLLTLLFFTCSGCAFIGGGSIGEVVYTSPRQEGPQYSYKLLKPNFTTRESATKPFHYADIVTEWGEPSKIIDDGKNKSVTFEAGLRWKGVMGILLLPLPLPIAVPVGHKTVTFQFANDTLINWTIHDSHYCVSYTGFNLVPIDPEGKALGLKLESYCQWHRDMTPYNGTMACDVLFYDRCYPASERSYGRGIELK